MAVPVFTSVAGPMGGIGQATGPEAWGTYGIEIVKCVIDTAVTSLVFTTKWLSYVDWVDGALAGSVAIDNTTSPRPTITLTIPSTTTVTSYFLVGGRSR